MSWWSLKFGFKLFVRLGSKVSVVIGATLGPLRHIGNLGTSGKSPVVRLAAGLGEDVRPEWHPDVRPIARPRLQGRHNSLISTPCQPWGATTAKCFPSTARRCKYIAACKAYCALIDMLHTFPKLLCHERSLELFDNWHKWTHLTNTNAILWWNRKKWCIPFTASDTKQQALRCISSLQRHSALGGWQRVTCHLVVGKDYLITYQIAFNVNRPNLFHKCASNNFWLFPLPKGRKINCNLKSSGPSICMVQCGILYIIWANKWLCDRREGERKKT